jgi:hypothetical protein
MFNTTIEFTPLAIFKKIETENIRYQKEVSMRCHELFLLRVSVDHFISYYLVP